MTLVDIIKAFLVEYPTHQIYTDAGRLRLLQLYNLANPDNQEWNRNCCACRSRLYSGLIKYINENES